VGLSPQTSTREETCLTNSLSVEEISFKLKFISSNCLDSLSAYEEKKEETDEEKFV
jgi:hypothetical protein